VLKHGRGYPLPRCQGGVRVRWRFQGFPPGPQSGSHGHVRPHGVQISPDKDMTNLSGTNLDARSAPAGAAPGMAQISFPYTTAAFTLPRDTGGLHHVVLTRPGTEPSMRFLSVGSYVCARASFRQHLAVMPLPSASSCHYLERQCRVSYRGLAPHQFMPMPGVHNKIQPSAEKRRRMI